MSDSKAPYLGLDPEEESRRRPDPLSVSDVQTTATVARGFRDELIKRGHAPEGRKFLRKFSTWEITRYLIQVSPVYFRRVLKENPDLPQGESEREGGHKWFTLEEVLQLRDYFAAEGRKTRDYKPYRPDGVDAKIVAVANFKGGVGKTSTAAHLAMAAALDGYKVLVVDLDSQGSMTTLFGAQASDEYETVFPLLARSYARSLLQENERLERAGAQPIPLEEEIQSCLTMDPMSVVKPTHWPNIDVIPATLELYWSEFSMPVWKTRARAWPFHDALNEFFDESPIRSEYDLIIVDTAPALGFLTINALAAADIVLVPLGASFLEFDSTGRFLSMLGTAFSDIESSERSLALQRGDMEAVTAFQWDAIKAVITRYDPNQHTEIANFIQLAMGDKLFQHRQEYTALVGQTGQEAKSIYESDYRNYNRDTYIRGRDTFDRTYAEFKKLLIGIWWVEEQELKAASGGEGEDHGA